MSGSTAALIFLHGSGDSGEGVESWLADVSGGAFGRTLREAGIATVFPDAPMVPYTLNGGNLQTVWFDRVAMAYNAPEDRVGMARSMEQVDAEIDRLVAKGIPVDRIGVAGMSMGGCLALHVAYGAGRHAGTLGMAASLSTFLAEDSGLDAAATARFMGDEASSSSSAPPLFMSHGDADRMIQLPWAQKTRDRLEACGVPAPAELSVWPGLGHDMCTEEVQQLTDFIVQHLRRES